MEAILEKIQSGVEFIEAVPAFEADMAAVHSGLHIETVRQMGLYDIAALSAGGAIQAAKLGLSAPSFGLIRPPGHHASANSSWGRLPMLLFYRRVVGQRRNPQWNECHGRCVARRGV